MLEKILQNKNSLIVISLIFTFAAIIQNLKSNNFHLEMRIEELERKLANPTAYTPATTKKNNEPISQSSPVKEFSKKEICDMLSGRFQTLDSQNTTERCELAINPDSEKIQKQISEIFSINQQNIGRINEELALLKARLNSKEGKIDLGKIDPNAKPDPNAPAAPENSLGGGAELKKENGETLCSQTWGEGYCDKGELKCKKGGKTYFRLGKSPSGLPKIHYICM